MKYSIYLFALLGLFFSCKKDFLDKKPNKALLVPHTLTDLQALLDNSNNIMNYSPLYSLFATDELFLADAGFTAAIPQVQNSYIWANDIYQGVTQTDWNRAYQQVLSANIVLEALGKLNPAIQTAQYNQVKGTALFARSFAFYHVAQQFAPTYQAASANQEPGIPLRLKANINTKSERASLRQTYDQINNDLILALALLPTESAFKTRPTKSATLALLARVALIMENYPEAGKYASASLLLHNNLLDYNNLNPATVYPMPKALANANPEVLYYAILTANSTLGTSVFTGINPELYHSYDENDLRKTLFFKVNTNGVFNFRGSYSGQTDTFSGIANGEVYLILAECEARAEHVKEAMDVLNKLLENRYLAQEFQPLTATDAADALKIILDHRRKELVFRNLRWTDLRRLNLDPKFAKIIEHTVKGVTYKLDPNSKKYTFQIPDDVIALTDMQQNQQ